MWLEPPQISSWVNYGTNFSNSAGPVSVVRWQMTFITGVWIQAYREGPAWNFLSPSQHSGTFLSLPRTLHLLSRLFSRANHHLICLHTTYFLFQNYSSFSVFLFKIEVLVFKNNPLSLGPGIFYHPVSLVVKCIFSFSSFWIHILHLLCIIDVATFCFTSLNDVTVSVVCFSMVLGSRGNRAFVYRFVPLGAHFHKHYLYDTGCAWAISGEKPIHVLFDVNVYFNAWQEK